MRILHTIQELGFGGAETAVAQLVRGSLQNGHAVAVAAAPGPYATAFEVPCFGLPMVRRSPVALWHTAASLRRAVKTWQPDLIHCHNPTMALAAVLSTGRGAPPCKLVTLHGLPERDYGLAAWILRILAQPTVACGRGVQGQLRKHGLDAGVIVNGCEPAPSPLTRATLDRDYPQVQGRHLVLGVGRLVASKHFGNAIRAVTHLPSVALVIAGDGPEREALRQEAARLRVADRVVFAGHRPDVRAMMPAADALVISSPWEGLPLVAIEAMMAGTPIVAARAPWQDDFLRDGDNALLVPYDDASATAGAIARLLADTGFARELAAHALATSKAHSASTTVTAYLDLYRSLLTKRSAA